MHAMEICGLIHRKKNNCCLVDETRIEECFTAHTLFNVINNIACYTRLLKNMDNIGTDMTSKTLFSPVVGQAQNLY